MARTMAYLIASKPPAFIQSGTHLTGHVCLSPPEVLQLWRTADAVCFDVDSTVCTDEGIDELAAYCGAGDAVAAWTTR